MTEHETYEKLYAVVSGTEEITDQAEQAEVLDFLSRKMQSIEARAAKMKAKAEEKRAQGDALRDTIYAFLTPEPQTIDQIMEQIDDEDVSHAKISARLTQLVKMGCVASEVIKVDSRRVKGYYIVQTDSCEEE